LERTSFAAGIVELIRYFQRSLLFVVALVNVVRMSFSSIHSASFKSSSESSHLFLPTDFLPARGNSIHFGKKLGLLAIHLFFF